MKFLGILRSSALCLLVSAFHGQPVSCGIFESTEKSKEDSTVESEAIEKPSQEPSTINLSDGSKNQNGSMATPSSNGAAKDMEADREGLLKRISEQRKELVERLSKSDAPFSLEDMKLFLGVLKDEAYVNPEAVQVGEKIHAYLGSLGIRGEDAKASLEKLMDKFSKYHEFVMDLFYGPIRTPSPEELIVAEETFELLEKLPKPDINTQANDCDGSDN
ncbi:merozoite surface protein 37/41 [Babesia divergens]|uniref:Merozoite surface protein 37/41 n=1 Tax=Babesia divergens TaxID=32595 RepID=A0AAD9GF00_BABDI|nr:merozoite surface protein 37/41 [Babesia divergens]